VELYEQCVASARALDRAQTDRDRETLGRVYDSDVERFDERIFALYEINPEELLLIRST
jgi:hypothetical protein